MKLSTLIEVISLIVLVLAMFFRAFGGVAEVLPLGLALLVLALIVKDVGH